MENHREFIERAREAASLPAQTKEVLGPESQEDVLVLEGEE